MHFANFIINFFRTFNRALQAKVIGNYFLLHVILIQSTRLEMAARVKDALAKVSTFQITCQDSFVPMIFLAMADDLTTYQ